MAPPPRRPPSLLPVIAVLALALAGALVLLVTRDGGDDAPRAAATAPTRTTAARPAGDRAADPKPRDRTAGWPVQGAAARRARVPILMYHLVAEAKAGTPYPELWVPPARFREQIAALHGAGFTAITMNELWSAWHDGGRLPRRPVVLSFDDGDISQVMNAAPVLERLRWPGVLNLAVNHLGKDGLPMWGARRMLRQGWEIDSHTTTHPDLTTLGAEALRRELAGSRRLLKRKLGVDARFFCYPAGRNDTTVRAAVKAAGYAAATTVEPGLAAPGQDPYLLPRIRVEPQTTGARLVQQARGTAAAPAGGGAA
ncbi:polysaccharide deacetylase family protein [Patulibacter defluvii]|uniref:polysaccharide deacetylase family protein n=1 Tax=Patulibacter defluvii TaxID=3095358 RepID=UPI002A765BA9|nr:polysaccharide deacetylase family protein [Patulibacter sp. DM4]